MESIGQCLKDDWITGMWYLVGGMSMTIAGLISLLVIGPVFQKR